MLLSEMFKEDTIQFDLCMSVLASAYSYYWMNKYLTPNYLFDFSCQQLASEFDTLPQGVKNLLKDDDFGRTGSLSFISREQYPQDVVEHVLNKIENT